MWWVSNFEAMDLQLLFVTSTLKSWRLKNFTFL